MACTLRPKKCLKHGQSHLQWFGIKWNEKSNWNLIAITMYNSKIVVRCWEGIYYDEQNKNELDACRGLHIFKHKYTWVVLSCCDTKKI